MSHSTVNGTILKLQSHEGERAVLIAVGSMLRSIGRRLVVRVIRSIRLVPGPYSVF